MKLVSNLLSLSLITGSIFLNCSLPTFAQVFANRDIGLCKQKRVEKFANQFQKICDVLDNKTVFYRYSAHPYYSARSRVTEGQNNKKNFDSFPESGEAKIASNPSFMRSIKIAQTPKKTTRRRAARATMLDSINIIPPKFDHPPVNKKTIQTVKGLIAGLPKKMYQILDEGGAKLHIGPNMLDRWPDALDGRHIADGHLYCNEPGRTYDKDMYIFERPLARTGSRQLGKIWSDKVLKHSVYNQCAHALDYMMGHFSSSREFKDLYRKDLKSMPHKLKSKLRVETAGTRNGRIQTFAEIVVFEMGLDSNRGLFVKKAFPKTTVFVRDSIKKIDLDKWTSK